MAGFSALGTKFAMSLSASELGGPGTTSTSSHTSTDWGDRLVGELTNISGPTMSADEIDVSSHDSDGSFRGYVAGFLDGGEISLEGNLMPDIASASTAGDRLLGAFTDRTIRHMAVVFPATGTAVGSSSTQLGHWLRWMFDGTVTGVETAAPFDDKASFSATVRVSGQPFLIATSGTGDA